MYRRLRDRKGRVLKENDLILLLISSKPQYRLMQFVSAKPSGYGQLWTAYYKSIENDYHGSYIVLSSEIERNQT